MEHYKGISQIIRSIFMNTTNAVTEKKEAKMKSCLQPAPKVLVSCRGLDGENNVLAVGYCGNCSYDPPMVMVGIVPTRYSYKMIRNPAASL